MNTFDWPFSSKPPTADKFAQMLQSELKKLGVNCVYDRDHFRLLCVVGNLV